MTPEKDAAALALVQLTKRFGAQLAVADVNLTVEPGEMIVLLGPSGCGKTTTLRMIAGFLPPSSGDVLLDGASIVGLPAYQRDMGIVFQSYALFPHMSVAENVRFGLEMRRWPRVRANKRVEEMLALVGLGNFAQRLPRQLSGGQQQRVALARALAIHPKVLLLDEPLSNLDAALRLEMAHEIRILQRDGGITAVMVTHDQSEAMAMADRMVVMRDGRVQQTGGQEDLYERPETAFVAGFIGRSNIVPGALEGAHLSAEAGCAVALASRYPGTGRASLAVRPEAIGLAEPGTAGARVEGTVELCTYLGSVVEHVVRLAPGLDLLARGAASGPGAVQRHAAGERVAVVWDAADERLFGADDRRLEPLAASAGRQLAAFGK